MICQKEMYGRRGKWISGSDGQVRGAVLKIYNEGQISYIERPVQKIIPLEITQSSVEKSNLVKSSVEKSNFESSAEKSNLVESDVERSKIVEPVFESSSANSGDVPNVESTVSLKQRMRRPPNRYEASW